MTKTTDVCDAHPELVQVAEPVFRDFGRLPAFEGSVRTVKVHEDNKLVRQVLESAGNGSVLVVDGGGSLRCALLGDQLAKLAMDNGWAGIIIYGAVRDTVELATLSLGIKALAEHPRKSQKRGEGQTDIPVSFAGISFQPGSYVYADLDGLVVTPNRM
jgi:regulator of ribonuclease activity A